MAWKNRGSGNEPRFPSRGARLWLVVLAAWSLAPSASASRFPSPGQHAIQSCGMGFRPTNLVDGVGTTRWAYDAMGRLRSETGPFGTTVSNGYDGLGRLTHLSFAGRTWSYQYDALGRITNVVAPEGLYRLGYWAQGGRKTSLAYPNGVAAKLEYDGGIRLTNLSYAAGADGRLAIRYGYDAADRRTDEIWSSGRALAYAYDGAHQLRGVSSTGRASDVAAYRYDNVGNPLGRTESGLGISNGFNNLNRITSGTWTGGAVTVAGAVNYNAGTVTVNGAVASRSGLYYERTNVALAAGTNLVTAVYRGPAFTNAGMVATSIASVVVGPTAYGHDANGNLWWDASLVYQYDVLKRLTNVYRYSPATVPILANRYDGLGRRVEAVRNGTNVERYVYVPGTFLVLAVLDATNGVKEIYTHGPDISGTLGGAGGIGGILSQTTGTNTHYLHPDAAGNVVLTTDASGKTTSILQYTPFGRLLSRSGTFASRFAFSSKEWEPSAGLYYYGYRWYSPGLGRWLSRDPLGEQADPLHNLYRFVGNNPLNAVDPLGLQMVGWDDEIEEIAKTPRIGYRIKPEAIQREKRELIGGAVDALLVGATFAPVPAVGYMDDVVRATAKTITRSSNARMIGVATRCAAKGLATGADEALFWSGIGRDGAKRAANWAAQHGGATLESTLLSRGISLPVWDASNPAVVSAWRQASIEFAAGARGNVRVLQGDALRVVDSIWPDEFRALQANPNVNSIRAINLETGLQVLLWAK